jgi:hypothetical protein
MPETAIPFRFKQIQESQFNESKSNLLAAGGIVFRIVLNRAARRPVARSRDSSKSWPVARSPDWERAIARCRADRSWKNQGS